MNIFPSRLLQRGLLKNYGRSIFSDSNKDKFWKKSGFKYIALSGAIATLIAATYIHRQKSDSYLRNVNFETAIERNSKSTIRNQFNFIDKASETHI